MANESLTALGLMSGTSMDGVDAALIKTDGERIASLGGSFFRAYSRAEREILRSCLEGARDLEDRMARPGLLAEAEALTTACHGEAVEAFLKQEGMLPTDISIIGFHGQTVLHRPEKGLTVQIGDGATLARRLGIRVAYDFRANDMQMGGQGAPLVPIFHKALCAGTEFSYPVLILNIGGVANVTYLPGPDEAPIACDTGPGGALLDDFMLERTGSAMDYDGVTSALGTINARALEALLAHPFFALPPPKSLDRNAFNRAPVDSLSTEDGAATLLAFTAKTIAGILDFLPTKPETIIISGGGTFNPTLMAMLAEAFDHPLLTADAIGWSSSALEAQAFAFLAVRTLKGLPLTYPSTTGIALPASGGVIAVP